MSRPSLRAVAGVALAGSLIVGGLAAFADETACGTWTDKKADSTTGQEGVPGSEDSQLDIVAASFDTVGDSIVGTITTAGLSTSSSDSGDEFAFDFTVSGVHMLMYVDRTAFQGQTVDVSAGFLNQSSSSAPSGVVTAKFDVKTKTVTLTGKITELAKSAAKPVLDQPVTKLTAVTADHAGGLVLFTYDDAPAPATVSPVVGVECGGGGAAPAPSAAAASASPSPSASASASGAPAASASGGPTAGCVDIADVKGDANPNATNPGAPTPNDPDLDLLAVNFKTDPDVLKAYLKVDKLGTKPSAGNGHRFDAMFTANGKIVEVYAGQPDAVAAGANGALVSAGQSAPAAGGVRIATVYNATVKTSSVFDVKTSTITLSIDRTSLDKALGAAVADGTTVTLTSAHARIFTPTAGSLLADTAQAAKPDEQVYTVGDNRCFAPVVVTAASASATSLIVSAPSRVQTSDVQTTAIRLTGSDGKPVAGGAVTARLGSGPTVSGKTNSSGTLSLRVPVTGPAAQRTLAVNYGTTTVRRATTVLAERSLLNYTITGTGGTRQVTVTLTDDDTTRHPYAGATVTFAYSGKKLTATTDKAGQAIVRVKTGTKMDMTYAGKPGYITSALRQTTVQ